MSDQPPHWGDLDKHPQPAPDDEFAVLCAQIFTSAPGKLLLEKLRKRHFDTGGNALADERALRVRAANQQFVRDLELARDRGSAAPKAK